MVAALAVFANLPHNLGTLKPFLWQAGFPVIYARGTGHDTTTMLTALMLDVLIWLAILLVVCALTFRVHRRNMGGDRRSG